VSFVYPYDDIVRELDGEDEANIAACYYVTSCETCGELSLYHVNEPSNDPLGSADLRWPDIGLDDSVPSRIRKLYEGAPLLKQRFPDEFAVRIRRAVEALCADLGAEKGPLSRMLRQLAREDKLPGIYEDMTNIVRLLGNIGAHDDENTVTFEQAQLLDNFFRSLVEYIYVLPHRIQGFNLRVPRAARM
jgi:hypothetical protein